MLHPELILLNKLIFNKCNFTLTNIKIELENSEYGACSFEIDTQKIKFRAAKTTPKKVGQFVTLWKKIKKNPIIPYDASDVIDLFVVSTKNNNNFGQFVFPKSVLVKQNILSIDQKGGKRGFRVYPLWDKPISKQAKQSQKWQLEYFVNTPINGRIDCNHVKLLYSN